MFLIIFFECAMMLLLRITLLCDFLQLLCCVNRDAAPPGPEPAPVVAVVPPVPMLPWYARDSTELQLIAIAFMIAVAFKLPRMGVWLPPPAGL
jgi:hypothetical protein